jgi:N-formylglutamate amidohydrolase
MVIPPSSRDAILLSEAELHLELLRMTDHYTDQLFLPCIEQEDAAVIAPVSRLIVDVERFDDDQIESMAEIGMGVIYESTSDLGVLRAKPSSAERELLLKSYYQPHHLALEQAVVDELERNGYAQIIDCHSFPSVPLSYELDKAGDRPDFCLGLDEFHTNADLAELIADFLRSSGFSVKLNSPFSGSMVSSRHYHSDNRVQSLMIEVNRSLYMEEETGGKTSTYAEIQQVISDLLGLIRRFPN